ncbi:Aspartyl/glutamyl-tRNA(Asn/Gln) amidotransferase subunit C [Geodia barretti]|uniref:Glutamyl-tRNA(Gln) amidotransferase subunit C, mitochondrial n=1 Tax=Geodia barretti TaxID=519541 RepID=A0AA35STK8_GEOBA|nr:Aspartyl/glutamyl-tRNA(Asn/Gln) amidotransferase subunit C [Geodia barretti]
MPIDREQVVHIAALARIGITDDEIDAYAGQLSDIIDQFEILNELDTSGVEPTGHAGELRGVMRDDTPADSLPPEDALRNAPRREGEYFRVRAVLDE